MGRGTSGFYVTGDNSKLYLVTARHVVFKPNSANNDTYECNFPSQPRVNVALFGTAAFNSYVERFKLAIGEKGMIVEFQDTANFTGNAIGLGTQIASDEFTRLMFPNDKNRHTFDYSGKNQQCTQGVFDAFFPGVMSYEIPDQPPLRGSGYRPGRRDALSYHLGPERRSVLHCHEAR